MSLSRAALRKFIRKANANPDSVFDTDTTTLQQVLKYSEEQYYNETKESSTLLEDKVYDLLSDLVKARQQEAGISSKDDMSHVPEPVGRMHQLPLWMGSASKMNHGDGQLDIWIQKYEGPYVISAKLDGASALYFRPGKSKTHKLYSRGKGNKGQDISELLEFLKLPALYPGEMVRGELMLRKSTFEKKYLRSAENPAGFSNSRNAVAGVVNSVGASSSKCQRTAFDGIRQQMVRDLKFLAYELVSPTEKLTASEQFEELEQLFRRRGVARWEIVDSVDDDLLSEIYDDYLENVDYEIDGLIVTSDHLYVRPTGKNPEYMRAYKKPLAILTGTTTVRKIVWEIGKEGYLIPVVHFDTLPLHGSNVSKASGYNAKFILDSGLGPGAVIDVIKSGGVIPKIIAVQTPVEPSFPDFEYEWNDSGVHIYPTGEAEKTEMNREVEIKKLHHFLTKLGTKGIGLKLVEKLYEGGIRDLPDLLTVTAEDLEFIGGKTATNMAATIQEHVQEMTYPQLAGASGLLGNLVGVTKAELIWEEYPDLLELPEVLDNDVAALSELLAKVPKFARKSARSAARGMADFVELVAQLEEVGIVPLPPNSESEAPQSEQLSGEVILLTGFRDKNISQFIQAQGGKESKSLTKATTLLLIKNDTIQNNKTQQAQQRGIKIMTADQFKEEYDFE